MSDLHWISANKTILLFPFLIFSTPKEMNRRKSKIEELTINRRPAIDSENDPPKEFPNGKFITIYSSFFIK